ncbi:hypothetical protein GCM10010123_40970 [Pilimelia anulata]|uniref:Fibronectin type-III domain-containing protein n=1 Tax=Pilimelia anulata TaxID=53371 RepID=A0A8J3BE03_9ACTN|nr:fibronectin type III domain-containing protein [Pilimelia anulata]GGK06999.1 hypothetical protein GCM10010123_40970 [Pilimelia anulata]
MLRRRTPASSARARWAAFAAGLLLCLSGATGALAAPPSTSGVLEYVAGTGVTGNVVPGPLANSPMPSPMAPVFDSQGNMYITTYGTGNCYVLKVTPAQQMSIFAGTGVCANASAGPALSATLNKPTNLAVDSQDNVYVTEDVGNKVDKITQAGQLTPVAGNGTSAGSIVEGPATASPMRVSGLVFDSQDNFYIGDWVRGYIMKVDTSGNMTIVAGNGTTTVTPGPARQSGLRGPYGLALDSQGNLYSTDYYLHYVYKITPAGNLSIFAGNGGTTMSQNGPATSTSLYRPWDVDVDASDNVYVTLSGTPAIVGITPGGTLSVVAGTGVSGTAVPGPATASPLRSTVYLTVRGTDIYFGDLTGNRILRVVAGNPPDAPTGLQGTPGNGSAALSFTAPVNTGSGPITGYQVSTDNGSTWQTLNTSGTAPVTGTVSGLSNGTSYTIRVRAVNSAGAGPASVADVVALPVLAPGAPTGLQVTAGNRTAGVSFTPPADNGGAAITSYEVSTDDGSTWGPLTTSGTNPVTGTVSNLTNNVQYTVRVRAVNSAGAGTQSGNATVTPLPGAPGAPGTVTATRGNASASLSFAPPADDGGSAITSYEVSTDDGTTWGPLSTTGTNPLTGTVSGLNNGTTYTVRVRAANSAGPGTASASTTVTPATTPAAPTGLSLGSLNGGATISFTPAADGGSAITGYEVSTDNGSTWATLTTAAGTGGTRTATVTGLTNGNQYQVRVRAVNAVGNGTATAASAVTPAPVAPAAPTGLSATPRNGGANLTLTPPNDTGGSPVTGYEYSVDGGTTWQTLTTAAGTGGTRMAVISGLQNAQQYTVTVRARNVVGPSVASTGTQVTPAAVVPDAPTGLSAERGAASAVLTFTPPADNGGSAITSYQYSTNGGSTWQTLATSAGTGGIRTGTVTGLSNGTTYTVTVRAVNAVGGGAASGSAAVTPATVPGAPTSLVVDAHHESLTLTFQPPGSTGGDALTGYQYSLDDGQTWATLPTAGGTGGARVGTVTNLVNGTTYTVRVRAVNSVGTGAQSAAEPGTPATTPDAPGGVSAVAGNAQATLTFMPATAVGSPVTSYEYSLDGFTWQTAATQAGTGGTRTMVVPGLVNGTGYDIRVRGVNAQGGGTASAPVAVVPGTPEAPSGVTAVAGTSSATVTWTAPADNGLPITKYVVTAAPGPATCVTDGATSCVIGGIAGTAYTYTVVAYAGNLLSPPSSASTAVTLIAPPVSTAPPVTSLLLTTEGGDISTAEPGEEIVLLGEGFAPYSTITVTLYSDPVVLGTAVADANGRFRKAFQIPDNLPPGDHTFVAAGVDADGNPHYMKLEISVPAAGNGSTGGLPVTGPGTAAVLALTGAGALLAGAGLLAMGWWRRRTEPAA